jgi:Leucine-rich repeat (LRR) protein
MMTPGQVEIATKKNWNVVMWDDDYENFIPYEGETPDGIEISEENFPDENFRAYVSSEDIDRNRDGYLSDDEIAAVTEIDVMDMDIEDLTGIGYFTALKTLYAGGNKLTELDLSKNTALDYLSCSDNQLTELDLGENTALTTLYCGGNQLTELDLRNNTKLESVNICNSQIYGEAMDRLIESLPTRTVGLGFRRFYAVDTNSETEGNIITKLQRHNLLAKRWSTLNALGNDYYPETIPGDFNGDGLVNTQDIDCLRDYILGIKSGMYIFTEAELTDDLKADIVDLTQLIEILLKR